MISLEKTGVTAVTIDKLISIVPLVGIYRLSLASLSLSQESLQLLVDVIDKSGKVISLKYLNL
jgi:hypothetical protein